MVGSICSREMRILASLVCVLLVGVGRAGFTNRVGFHLGQPGGVVTNVLAYMQQLDSAGLPFSIKNVNAMGLLSDAAALKNASGIDHTIVWRSTNTDVPPYNLAPEDAATTHWAKVKSNMPPQMLEETYKDLVAIEVINEPDATKCGWLANFSTAISKLAVAEGYTIYNFAWSTGTPGVGDQHPNCWATPEMLTFLRYAATQNGKVGVALHEYSNALNATNEWPWLLGRFHFLFDTCDQQGIARPPVFISEWGWEGCTIPLPPPNAIQNVDLVNRRMGQYSYMNYPEIKGMAMWYLGPWSCSGTPIANQVDQVVLPMANYTIQSHS